jgi:prepilin-type N-terminal cleavage/methylation domain-containing protein
MHSKKAFTIVELLVAMALMAILMALSSLIFATAVRAHRTADSTVEIVRRAGSIAGQLSADLRGLQADAPLAIWFENADTDGDGLADTRYDQILFFANGDFQTIKQYNRLIPPPVTVQGNISRIYYGHAWQVNTAVAPWTFEKSYRWVSAANPGARLLSRRTHLMTSDTSLSYIGVSPPFPDMTDPATFVSSFVPARNNIVEYDQASLTHWQNLVLNAAGARHFLQTCFVNTQAAATAGRPMIDMKNADTLHLLLSEQISEFKVQFAYRHEDRPTAEPYFEGIKWFQSDGTGPFGFGVYFNMSNSPIGSGWTTAGPVPGYPPAAPHHEFVPGFFPRAFKFTFTVHDAKGLFPEGRTFTQIVYLEN